MEDFNQGQKAFIKLVVVEVLKEAMPEIMENHVNACPYGKRMNRIILICLGIGIGLGLSVPALAKMVIAKLAL